jgi:hypothetical protein
LPQQLDPAVTGTEVAGSNVPVLQQAGGGGQQSRRFAVWRPQHPSEGSRDNKKRPSTKWRIRM